MFRLTPVVKNLLLVNIGVLALVFFAERFFRVEEALFTDQFALHYVFSEYFQPYQFITYMFMHADIGHLFGNMLALFFFGPWLEQTWGAKRFFIFYLVTGVGAGLLYGVVQFVEMQMLASEINNFLASPSPSLFAEFIKEPYLYREYYGFFSQFDANPNSFDLIERSKAIVQAIGNFKMNMPMVGASGAVFGILLAFGMLFPNAEIFLLFPPIPIKAKYLVTFYGLYEIYALIQQAPGDNVAHLAHIGGMIFAYFFVKGWKRSGSPF